MFLPGDCHWKNDQTLANVRRIGARSCNHTLWQGKKRPNYLTAWADAWNVIVPLLQSGAIKPIMAKTFPLAEAANALRYPVEGRPFGRVVLTI
jgi:NADPH:quinone reductase-like Zn-dependent oxidoreductase